MDLKNLLPKKKELPPLECGVSGDNVELPAEWYNSPIPAIPCQIKPIRIAAFANEEDLRLTCEISDRSEELLFRYLIKVVKIPPLPQVTITGNLVNNTLLWLKYLLCESPDKAPDFYQSPTPFEIVPVSLDEIINKKTAL